jgi:deazaflavin-dependent oxidoreductase (nitroreductase family)
MIKKTTLGSAPRGLTRMASQLPIWLYRLQLGWLLGDRFLMLTHIGRKTGQPRQTVLEVVRHDRATGHYIIASGWGERADWFRNIQKNPNVLVASGWRRWEAVAERLPSAETANELCDYAQHHSYAVRALSRLMIGETLRGSAEDCRRLAERVPMVMLRARR